MFAGYHLKLLSENWGPLYGYQYYWFNATGTNNWVGGSSSFDSLNSLANPQMFAPVKTAQDIYGTFEVHF